MFVRLPLRALLAAVSTAFFVSSSARADDAAESATVGPLDTVHLKDGARRRGRLTEVVPGDHVTIVDGDRTMVFPWGEVARVVVSTIDLGAAAADVEPAAPPADAPPPPTEPDAPPDAPTVGPFARVSIATPKPVVLYRRPSGTKSWVFVCNTPCTTDVPVGDSYQVQGSGMRPSKEFRLGAGSGDEATITVDPPSTAGVVLGGVGAGVGGVTSYIGLSLAAGDKSAGAGALLVGTGMLVGGIVLFIVSRGTDVTVSSARASASQARPSKGPTRRTLEALFAPAESPSSERDASTLGPPRLAPARFLPAPAFPALLEATF